MLSRIAHAKINLALHITGQRDDGYHLLDSIVGFAEFGDKITVQAAAQHQSEHSLEIGGPFSGGLEANSNNLVLKAANAYSETVVSNREIFIPVHIQLEKNLPIASGIGGGSADAAATLLTLQELWGSRVDPASIANSIGADVLMCLHSKPLRAQGIGDEITLLNNIEPMHLVLVNPNVEVSTPAIFKALTNKENPGIGVEGLSEMRNDLQLPAIKIAPIISEVIDALEKQNPVFARMSGSGATCFGVFETADAAQAAQSTIQSAHPDWWSIATTTIGS